MQTELSKEEIIALASTYDADFNPTAGSSIIITEAQGALLTDTDRHQSIDLSDIIANIGHSHPQQVTALQAALEQMITAKSGLTNPARAQLAAKLVEITPDNLDKAYLVSGGGEVIDWAIRIARRATGKHEILSFWGGVYGRTYATMSLNGVQRRRRQFGPMMPGVIHAPFPYCYRCPFDKTPDSCDFYCVDFLDQVMLHESTDDLAAIIVEPYQGVGGMIFPPDGYLPRLQEWSRSRGVLFILDEIQSSFGRTGNLFALERENLQPDMLCIGKGLGSGISIAALVAESRLFDTVQPGELSGGNGGNPVACTAALSVIDIMEAEALPEHAHQIGEMLLARFRKWLGEFACIGDVRGWGASLAIEFVKDRDTKEPYPEIVQQIKEASYPQGVYLSSRSHILDIRPPLVITLEQAQYAADVIEEILRQSVN
ncbi:aspartate aminotransferase family protein [Chloroflexota bacterium]